MSLRFTRRGVAAAAGATALAIGLVGIGTAVAATAAAGAGRGPAAVYRCAPAVQRYHTGPHGEVTFVTANGSTLTFPSFGYLVAYLQQNGICR